ncbi:MAG: response regulator transcription factor [Chloroflexi bacterium]|nr:response regulator transcription factor [Chloroflexota bacterium]
MNQSTHLLIIEDDPAIARSLQDGLKRDGYAVTWKNNGADGIAYAREQNPQLIILDVRLPDGSGFDFCKQMRALGIRQPILMLTVQHDEIDKVLGLEMGADDYLTKPYSLRELLARVRALLRRAYGEFSSAESNVLFVRDLTIDLARSQVQRGNQILALTPTEFRLLVYLAQNAGQALTREQILQAVWGHAIDVEDDRTVNVHIRRLREKIEIDPSHPSLILTVPGIGYRLSRQ